MRSNGISGLLVETHNWGKTVAFWKGLGYELEFETDHHSGQLRHPSGGPYVFVAERPPNQALKVVLAVGADDAGAFEPPSAGKVVRGFEPQHFPALEMVLADPDGREISVHAPLPAADHTAVRVALWRALHVELDAAPHVVEDEIGLRIAQPDPDWRKRPDMDPATTRGMRASIVARARCVEDLVAERKASQYVILGAGLDTFAQRRPASGVRVFEIDRPAPLAWKRARLAELGLPIPALVPVDFEAGQAWWPRLVAAGFEPARPAVVSSTGVSMYLDRETNAETLRTLARALAPGSTVAMTFMIPIALVADPAERAVRELAERGARDSGSPFVSFYAPDEIVAAARAAGFREATHVSAEDYASRYFANRGDGLRPASSEQLLVASV